MVAGTLLITEGYTVYDSGGRRAASIEAVQLSKLNIMVAPNGGGKTTLLSLLNPVFSAPRISTVEQLAASYTLYQSLRPLPPAAGAAALKLPGERKLYALWASVAASQAIERLRALLPEQAEGAVKALQEAMRVALEPLRLEEKPAQVARTIEPEAWRRGEFRTLIEWGAGKRRVHRRSIFVAVLWLVGDGEAHLHAVAYYARRWVAALARGDGGIDAPLYYHPVLVVNNRELVDAFSLLWTVLSSNEREVFLDYCRDVVKGCVGLNTGFRDAGLQTVAIEASDVKGHEVLPLFMLGDGQRAALALALLASRSSGVLAVDTPESFTHPDMLDLVARILVEAASSGLSVLVSTQSAELLKLLLGYAEQAKMLPYTLVYRLAATRSDKLSRIKVYKMSGKEAYYTAADLGMDIRRMRPLEAQAR